MLTARRHAPVKFKFVPLSENAADPDTAAATSPRLTFGLCVTVRSLLDGEPTHCVHVEASDAREGHWEAVVDPVPLVPGQHLVSLPDDLREVVRFSVQKLP
jgi:hypothetical protein